MSGSDAPEGCIRLSELATLMDRMWQAMVEFPMPRVCKHHAAGIVIQEMETLGIAPPDDIIRAVVFAHDDVSLAWKRSDDDTSTTHPDE